MLEIERKFLVTSEAFKKAAQKKIRITQGFLNKDPERTVRIRLKDNKGFITIKGISDQSGISRFEWEKEIPLKEATTLLKLCEKGIIDKYRYEVMYKNHLFEVDEFLKDNKGLILAEIELQHANDFFEKPPWIGQEVTGEIAYYNSQLSKKPYKTW